MKIRITAKYVLIVAIQLFCWGTSFSQSASPVNHIILINSSSNPTNSVDKASPLFICPNPSNVEIHSIMNQNKGNIEICKVLGKGIAVGLNQMPKIPLGKYFLKLFNLGGNWTIPISLND